MSCQVEWDQIQSNDLSRLKNLIKERNSVSGFTVLHITQFNFYHTPVIFHPNFNFIILSNEVLFDRVSWIGRYLEFRLRSTLLIELHVFLIIENIFRNCSNHSATLLEFSWLRIRWRDNVRDLLLSTTIAKRMLQRLLPLSMAMGTYIW